MTYSLEQQLVAFRAVLASNDMGALTDEDSPMGRAIAKTIEAFDAVERAAGYPCADDVPGLNDEIEAFGAAMARWNACYGDGGYMVDAVVEHDARQGVYRCLDRIDRLLDLAAGRLRKTVRIRAIGGTMFSAYRGGEYLGNFEAGVIDDEEQWQEGDDDIEDVVRASFDLDENDVVELP